MLLHLDLCWACCWARVGAMFSLCGRCCGNVGPVLGLSWTYFGPILAKHFATFSNTLMNTWSRRHLRCGRICKMAHNKSWAQCPTSTSSLIAQGGEFPCFHSGWRQRCHAYRAQADKTKLFHIISVVAQIMRSWEWYEQTSVTALPVLKGFAKIWVFQFQVSISFRIFFSFILLPRTKSWLLQLRQRFFR